MLYDLQLSRKKKHWIKIVRKYSVYVLYKLKQQYLPDF